MTKYTRITGKVFGSSATATGDDPEIGQFGSALAGTYNGTTDVSLIQSLPAWQKGFISAVTPSTQFPPLPEMTGFGKVLSQQICYLLQQGIAEWDSGTTYYENNWCAYNGKLYISKSDENLNNLPTNVTYWTQFTGGFSRNFGEIVTSSLPLTDGTLHLADGSLLSQQDYPEFTSYIANLYNSIPSGEFSQATQNANLATKSNWVGIACGFINGVEKYVALSSDGYISNSIDGINWSIPIQRSFIYDSSDLRDIMYDGVQFIVVSAENVYVSQNTQDWTVVYTGEAGAENFNKLAYGNGKYVSVTGNGLSVSRDLRSWTQNLSVLGSYICFINNKFIVIKQLFDRTIFYESSNLSNWSEYTSRTLSTARSYRALIYSQRKYILIDSEGYIAETTSLDQSWSQQVQDSNLGSHNWKALCYNNLQTKAVILGTSGYTSSLEKPFTNVFTTEADWQATYTTYGECGKYVYNPNANTVRLPLYASYFTNTSNPDNVGVLTPASIPNIKGVIPASEKLYKSGTTVSDYGAFRDYAGNTVSGQSDNSHFDNDLWNFDASRVSSVYSDTATTVNTQSIKQLVYIVVAK